MFFSIVIPTYNGADYIEKALLSAINQTRKADAIIVSDDNSTDNTLEICARYKEQISIYKNENGPSGFVEGWNNAIRLVNDGYIAILHQDDLLAPTFLEEAEIALERHPEVKHFFVPCNYINKEGRIIREPKYCDGSTMLFTKESYIDAYINMGSPHIHRCPGVITHRSIFDFCIYRKDAGHIADDDFFYRVGDFTEIIGLLKPLASYREHRDSETGHLNDLALDTRLANDYLFQVEEQQKTQNTPFILHCYMERMAAWFVYRQFVQVLQLNDLDKIDNAVYNYKRLIKLNVKPLFKCRSLYLFYKIFGMCITFNLLKFLK